MQTAGSAREQETSLNVYSFSFKISSACPEFPPPTAEVKGKETINGEWGKVSCLEWLKSKLPSTLKPIYSNATSENWATSVAFYISTSNQYMASNNGKSTMVKVINRKCAASET